MILNYPLICNFLNSFVPCACLVCEQRQTQVICNTCLRILHTEIQTKKCVICANPHTSWVCKRCKVTRWGFDTTHSLSSEYSRLVPLIKRLHLHGNLKQAAGICFILDKLMVEQFIPVDLFVPLPEPLIFTQKRGFQSHFEVAKLLSKQQNTPLCTALLDTLPSEVEIGNPAHSPFRMPNLDTFGQILSQRRVGVIGCSMHSEYIYHHFAKELKTLGALWVSNWIMLRIPNQISKTCSILS